MTIRELARTRLKNAIGREPSQEAVENLAKQLAQQLNDHAPTPQVPAAQTVQEEKTDGGYPAAWDRNETSTNHADWLDLLAFDEADRELDSAGIAPIDVSQWVDNPPEPPDWIVQDFVARGSKCDLCGSSKSRKTFLALQAAVSIAAGRDFIGFKVPRPRRVAYLDLELPAWNAQERVFGMANALGLDIPAVAANLVFYNLRGRGNRLRDHAEALVGQLEKLGVDLVVVDPRYKILKPGEDENSVAGLQGVLDFRDRLAEHFAVLLVTHDCKGDTSAKKTTDRGAGSYAAGADFDSRLTIDRAASWTLEKQNFVVEAECRTRPAPPPVGLAFDDGAFAVDPDIAPIKWDGRTATASNVAARAERERATQEAYRAAALNAVESAGSDLLSIEAFDACVARSKAASMGINQRAKLRKLLVESGALKTCRELERKPGGRVDAKRHGRVFISTPEKVDAYIDDFSKLAI